MENRRSAPEELRLVEEFLRTRNEIHTVAELAVWERRHGLRDPQTPAMLRRALGLREALRALMLANNGFPPDAPALAHVNAEIRAYGLRPVVAIPATESAGLNWEPRRTDQIASLVPALLSRVLAAMADGTWSRMKACAADDCRYAFYDHTRNRSGRWCDVAGCGGRARMRDYRHRHSSGR